MQDEIMSEYLFENFRLKLFRALRRIVPKGSALDTIFDSYDDWRDFGGENPAESGKKDTQKPDPNAGA
jgi:hypothetical protein